MTALWLIGENNPYRAGKDPHYDLYPFPERATGHRLQTLILQVSRKDYLDEDKYERRNLLRQAQWSAPAARESARRILDESGSAPLVLLGQKVCDAFGFAYKPFTVVEFDGRFAALLGHPSGLNRLWNEPRAFERARETIEALRACAASQEAQAAS